MIRFNFIAGWLILFVAASVAYAGVWDEPAGNVYWGDLHIHTEYSIDAVYSGWSKGRFAREAGQYALYCSRLDFYSVTDHAEMLTKKEYWPEAIDAAHNFNKIGASMPDSRGDPRIVAFTGWEWTQSGPWGHKNVILKWDDAEKLPPSPIRAYAGAPGLPEDALEKDSIFNFFGGIPPLDIVRGMRYGKNNLQEFIAPSPADLFTKLRKYCLSSVEECDAVVIPHGNAWRTAPPMYSEWEPQLDSENHDPDLQRLIEIYSKHGNSEEYKDIPPDYRYYRDGKEVSEAECSVPVKPSGVMGKLIYKFSGKMAAPSVELWTFRKPKPGCKKVCQPPNENYEPCCWRAGEIVKERCLDPESEWCKQRIARAKRTVKPFKQKVWKWEKDNLKPEYRDNPSEIEPAEWETCGQCRTCWQPAGFYTMDGSVQKALASAYFDADGNAHHYRFGFVGSTDTHQAWGGSVKETKQPAEIGTSHTLNFVPDAAGWERAANYRNPGGLVAIVSPHRTRDDLWKSLKDKHVYSTSGPRIEVWARAEIKNKEEGKVIKMGGEAISASNPTFHIRANGTFAEDDTCPYEDEPLIKNNMSRSEFERVCMNQCYRVTDERISIDRIEVVKILQPLTPREAEMEKLQRREENPDGLIMDPYHVENISGKAIEWSWTDENFVDEPEGRSVAYYFRIIQEPTPGYNCNPTYLLESGESCDRNDPAPARIERQINPQDGSEPVPLSSIEDACYTDLDDPKTYCEERAWTSPFYIIRE